MEATCTFEDRTAQPTLSIHVRAAVQDLPGVFGEVIGALMQYLGELGEHPAAMPFAAYRNLDQQDLDVEIGFPVVRSLPARDASNPVRFPAGIGPR
jgi:hypothetical protein